jgi:hypothetical protein
MRILRFIRSIFCHHWYVEGHKHFYPGLREHGDTHDTTIQDIKCRKCSAEALLRIETPTALRAEATRQTIPCRQAPSTT